ncbi:MAG: rod shape-determining protein MreC [Methyloligellaceae bacterium]
MLLVLSRLDNDYVRAARNHVSDLATPVLEWASLPAVYARHARERVRIHLSLHEELRQLKEENERLKQWRWRAQRMERRLRHMRALLNAVDEQALDQVTARVIGDARGPFVRSILLNAGRDEGVKPGYAVINGDGLVGRTVHVGTNASRVILLNDLNSRIPVLVGPSAVRGVLVGDNSDEPRLEFLPDTSGIFEGDEVYTSGDAGLLPRGIRIGAVSVAESDSYRVRLHATLTELEFVSVLFFDSPLVVATETPLVAAPAKGGRGDTALAPGGPLRADGESGKAGRKHAQALDSEARPQQGSQAVR